MRKSRCFINAVRGSKCAPRGNVGFVSPGIDIVSPGIGIVSPGIDIVSPGIGIVSPGIDIVSESANAGFGSGCVSAGCIFI